MVKEILIIGTHGQSNFGDELLLRAFLEQLPVNTKYYVNSYYPEQTKRDFSDHDIITFHTRNQKHKLMQYLMKSKVVLFAGGSILKELNPSYGGDRYQTLNIIRQICIGSRLVNTKIFLCNIGIGPIGTPQGLKLSGQILKLADFISVRDRESEKYLKKIGVGVSAPKVPDAVFGLTRSSFGLPASKPLKGINEIADVKKITVNVTRNIANPANWDYFIEHLENTIVNLHKLNNNIEFIGLPLQIHESANDHKELLMLRERLLSADKTITFKILEPAGPKDVAKIIDDSDIFIAEKLHAIIASTIIATPFVALMYDVKVQGLIADLGLDEYSVDICSRFGDTEIFDKVIQAAASHGKLEKELSKIAERLRKSVGTYFGDLNEKLRSQ